MEDQTSAAKKKRISVVVIGEAHRDHAPTLILRRVIIHKLKKLGLKVRFCSEQAEDQTLAIKTERDKACRDGNRQSLALPVFSKHLRKDNTHAKPYFTRSDHGVIEGVLEKEFHFSKASLPLMAGQLARFNYFEEAVEFNAFLASSQIPFQGLEMPEAIRNQLLLPLYNTNLDDNPKVEVLRIEYMTKMLFEKVIPAAEDNTVVICMLGEYHRNNLAENISLYHEQHLSPTVELNVTSLLCASSYVSDLYKTNLVECNHGNDFESDELCKIFQDAAMFAKPPKLYFIPDVNESKRALVQSLSGAVIQERQGGIYARLRSCELTADRRKALGIERSLITLAHGQANKLEQLKSQKEFITIEETCFPHKYLVTFPPNQLAFVEGIIKGNKSSSQKTIVPSQRGK